jgi:hypothetical protein
MWKTDVCGPATSERRRLFHVDIRVMLLQRIREDTTPVWKLEVGNRFSQLCSLVEKRTPGSWYGKAPPFQLPTSNFQLSENGGSCLLESAVMNSAPACTYAIPCSLPTTMLRNLPMLINSIKTAFEKTKCRSN